jgi:hypothetical protein
MFCLPCCSFFPSDISAPPFKGARPEQLRVRIPVSLCSHHHPQFFFFFPLSLLFSFCFSHSLTHSMGARCFYITGSSSALCSFFRFGGGRPLHSVQFLFFCSGEGDPAICFAVSSPITFSLVLPHNRPAVLSFLRRSCRLAPGSFFALPLSWRDCRFFLSRPTLWVGRSTVDLMCSLRHAIVAWRGIFL